MTNNLMALGLWRQALLASVRRPGPDLTARQLALLLTVYLTHPPHTVRGLAASLNVSKPAITRALDRLSILGFIRRKRDDADKRSVLVQRTVKGSVYLSEFAQIVIDAGAVHPADLAAMVAEQMSQPAAQVA
ncbi:MAG TPA: MarR family transcriptional regulator [Azospirillaceae bacterium]|nr:MarR family transcriptional regulator [Azospirillaceae bacterium]